MGDIVFKMVKEAFEKQSIPIKLLKTNIVLISKEEKPILVQYFRLISLCNVCYKILSKVIVNKICHMLDELINHL